MSGHSKWAQIKRQKGVADVKKGSLFTKLGRVITVVAKEGGGNPETNFKLRLAMDKAKAANMPNENIERAIKRGTGEGNEDKLETITYEAYGPAGTALVIEALTDNRNRTISIIRGIINKYQGNLAGTNSVLWMFEPKGVIGINLGQNKEEVELKAIDAGADDVVEEGENLFVYTKPADLKIVKDQLEKNGIKAEYAEIELLPKTKVVPDEKTKEKIKALFNELDDNEEVNNYYSNADLSS